MPEEMTDDLETESTGETGEIEVEAPPEPEKIEAKPADDLEETPPAAEAEESGEIGSESGEKQEKAPDPPKNPRHDAQARVLQATNRVAQERERADRAEARLRDLEAQRNDLQAPVQPADPGVPPKPTQADFQTDAEYVEAVADWKADRKIEAFKGEMAQDARNAAAADESLRVVKTFNEHLETAKAADPDFLDRVDNELLSIFPTFMLTPDQTPGPANDMAEAIVKSDNTAALMLHMSAHPEEVRRILALPTPLDVAVAMGRLDATVGRAEAPPSVPVPSVAPTMSKAHAPVTPVTTSTSKATDEVTDDSSLDDHFRIYNAQDRKRRQGSW